MFEATDYINRLTELVKDFTLSQTQYLERLNKVEAELPGCLSLTEKQNNMKQLSEVIIARSLEMKEYNESLQDYFDGIKERFFKNSSENHSLLFDKAVIEILLDRIGKVKSEIAKINESTKELTGIIGVIGVSAKQLLVEFTSTEEILKHILFIFEA